MEQVEFQAEGWALLNYQDAQGRLNAEVMTFAHGCHSTSDSIARCQRPQIFPIAVDDLLCNIGLVCHDKRFFFPGCEVGEVSQWPEIGCFCGLPPRRFG